MINQTNSDVKQIVPNAPQVVLSDDLNISTEQFLQIFGDVQCFRTFSDVDKTPGKNFSGPFESVKKELKFYNREKKGVFFIPNSGGHKDQDITRITSVFMDLDDVPIQPVLDVVAASGLTPHAIIQSSPGDRHHLYWLVENFPVERFRPIQRRFIELFGHDKLVINESRVMRLVGFLHQKRTPFLTRVIFFCPEIPKYSEQQIIDGLGLTIEVEPTNTIVGRQVTVDRKLPAVHGERDDKLFRLACELEAKNSTYDFTLSECISVNQFYKPPLDIGEVKGRVKSAWNYREDRLKKLDALFKELSDGIMEDRIKLVQNDENVSLLFLAKATDPTLFSKIEDLFKNYKKYLREALKAGPVPSIAGTSGNQLLKELPGCPDTFPGQFQGFPTVDGYSFRQTAKGVSMFYNDTKGQPEVCHTATFIIKRFTGDNQDSFLEAAWAERGEWRRLKAPRGQFFNAHNIVDLANRDFPVGSANANALAKYLQAFEAAHLTLIPEQKISFQTGWLDKSFMAGKQCISLDSTTIEFQPQDAGEESVVEALKSKGEYRVWLDAVNAVSRYPLPMIALYASLAAPLIKPLEIASLGIDFSGRTSTGKTTILRTAASVWGQPDEGISPSMTRTWNATAVAAERLASVLSDLPLILDDTKQATNQEKTIKNILYGIPGGQGRSRGSKRGLQPTKSWRTILISCGEAPAVSYITEAGVRARILTIRGLPFEADNTESLAVVSELNSKTRRNYGFAGPLFVRWLVDNQNRWPEFRAKFEENIAFFKARAGVSFRLADYAAVITTAGQLAHEALNLPWTFDNPMVKVWPKLLRESEEADLCDRAALIFYDYTVSHPGHFYNKHAEEKEPPSGWVGRWDESITTEWTHIDFIPSRLKGICNAEKLDFGAVCDGLVEKKMAINTRARINKAASKVFRLTRAALEGDQSGSCKMCALNEACGKPGREWTSFDDECDRFIPTAFGGAGS